VPLAKIHVVEGRYDEGRMAKVSGAIQAALMNTLRVPPEDFYQLIFEFPKKRFLHTPSFVGMHYTDDLIIPDLTFIEGRSKESAAGTLERRQHPRCRGGPRGAGRPDDHALRGPRREFLLWPGRGAARQRRSA
jgi:phenylpyruvate tautomerase PptA (4-oxalocrotonate tautomerase family)